VDALQHVAYRGRVNPHPPGQLYDGAKPPAPQHQLHPGPEDGEVLEVALGGVGAGLAGGEAAGLAVAEDLAAGQHVRAVADGLALGRGCRLARAGELLLLDEEAHDLGRGARVGGAGVGEEADAQVWGEAVQGHQRMVVQTGWGVKAMGKGLRLKPKSCTLESWLP